MGNANIGRHLGIMAAAQPRAPALKIPRGRTRTGDIDYLTLSFAELDAEARAWSARLGARGVVRGDRVLLMVRPGLPLIAAAFAIFRVGAVPVVIDPGMGLKNLLRCVAQAHPRALVGIPLAQMLSRVLPWPFRSVKVRIPASSSPTALLGSGTGFQPVLSTTHGLKAHATIEIREAPGTDPAAFPTPDQNLAISSPSDLAAILFTSGSTGAPKGVCYEHGMFDAQVRLIRDTYGITPGEVDLPMLPIFALFNPALGMTSVIPEIDPAHPAAADPAKIVQAIRQEKVTNSFGSPTLWRMISDHCRENDLTLPSLRRVLCAGAPVPATLWAEAGAFLPSGRLHSPYGATEALPITSISDDQIEGRAGMPFPAVRASSQPGPEPTADSALSRLERTAGRGDPALPPGAPVGAPLAGIQVKIISIVDSPISTLAQAGELSAGRIGEIIVQGPVVTRAYDGLPEVTARAKISGGPGEEEGSFWHRMGDCGYLDGEGRLWFCGRVAERVETAHGPMYTEPCERVFRRHPQAARCALIGLGAHGSQIPALVAETRPKNTFEAQALAQELGWLARQHPQTAAITRFYFHPHFPVDVRHNAKIHRLVLAKWAVQATVFEFKPA